MNAQLRQIDTPSLPLPAARSENRRRRVGSLTLDDVAIARFNQRIDRIAANAPHIDADQLVTLARWLQAQPEEQRQYLLAEPLQRAEWLNRMLADNDWALDDAMRERARLLVDYLAQQDDLIPDQMPLFGQLDDALLVELVWPTFAGETQDYRDYCRFRIEQQPRGTPDERRLAWEGDVLRQANDMLQRRRISASRYANTGLHQSLFRVS